MNYNPTADCSPWPYDSQDFRIHSHEHITPSPQFDYYYKACRKGDSEAKAVAVNQSPVAVLAAASEITGLSRDNFEVHEISKEEFDGVRFR